MPKKTGRVPVNVDASDYAVLKRISDKTGIPISVLVRKAIAALVAGDPNATVTLFPSPRELQKMLTK